MVQIYRFVFREDDQEERDRQTASLAALAVVLLLVVVGLFLVRTLSAKAAVEDCLISGRRNCDAVLAANPAPLGL